MLQVAKLLQVTAMRVWTEVPDSWKEPLEKACKLEGWERISQYLRELIKKDLKEKGLLGVLIYEK